MGEKKSRIPIPEDLAADVLFKSDMTCCVCRVPDRQVQIHHMDEDPSNNEESNLAVLCLLCHNKTQQEGGFGRRLNSSIILKYKSDWESIVRNRRSSTNEPRNVPPPETGRIHISARWISAFDLVVGRGATPLERKVSVEITNRDKVPRYIEVLGFRIDPEEGASRYVQLHLIGALAHIKEKMESGERQSFSVSLANLTSGPFHDGLKEGEALSVFIRDTLGESWYSEPLDYVEE